MARPPRRDTMHSTICRTHPRETDTRPALLQRYRIWMPTIVFIRRYCQRTLLPTCESKVFAIVFFWKWLPIQVWYCSKQIFLVFSIFNRKIIFSFPNFFAITYILISAPLVFIQSKHECFWQKCRNSSRIFFVNNLTKLIFGAFQKFLRTPKLSLPQTI